MKTASSIARKRNSHIVESGYVIYAKCLKSHSKKRAVLYAITANMASLFSGPLIDGILM